MIDDRRIHIRFPDGREVVRYDRAGKWYMEFAEDERKRYPLPFREVVTCAAEPDAEVRFGVPGGQRFDKAVRDQIAEAKA